MQNVFPPEISVGIDGCSLAEDHPTIDFEPDKKHEKYLIPSLTFKSGMNWKVEMNISFHGIFVETKKRKKTPVFLFEF